jgi:HEAT repeat protein
LLDGIKSENDGIKRSSIYFVGKYKIADAEDLLIKQLNKEQNPDNRILIALVLYKLGSENGILTIKKLAAIDNNHKVRTISTLIYNEYLQNILIVSISTDYKQALILKLKKNYNNIT